MKKDLITLVVLLVQYGLFGQQYIVEDFMNQLPLPGVSVEVPSKNITKWTNFEGEFSLENIDLKGDELLRFKLEGYKDYELPFSALKTKVYLEKIENVLDEVVLSVSRWKQQKRELTQKVVSISSAERSFLQPQTSADLLQASGKVFVQKSQLGGGSPIIRGFATNRVLLVVDGVRMNNAIFRGGNIQNIISIDPFTVERTELSFGPNSLVYGSDAIGGVMNFYSKNAQVSNEEDLQKRFGLNLRYSTANNERTVHFDHAFSRKKWSLWSSLSFSDFADLKMGGRGLDDYLRPTFVKKVGGQDVTVVNDDPRVQKFSGFSQIYTNHQLQYYPSEHWKHSLGFYYSQTSDYPRYDRLLRPGTDENLRYGDWYYGPQKWLMFRWTQELHKNNTSYRWTNSYQNFEESRNERGFNDPVLFSNRERVKAYQSSLDAEKKIEQNRLRYGLSLMYNQVFSEGEQVDLDTNTSSAALSRYPDNSSWTSTGAYVSFDSELKSRLRSQIGLRFNRDFLKANLENDLLSLPFSETSLTNNAFTGSFGLNWTPERQLQLHFNLATGFRAPNIDDVGKIFDSEPGSVVVPNPDLKPEYAYTAELGFTKQWNSKSVINVATYFTYLKDILIRRPFELDGATELLYKGVLSQIQAIQNGTFARVFGVEWSGNFQLSSRIKLSSNVTYTLGKEYGHDDSISYSRHAPPLFSDLHIKYLNGRFLLDLSAVYNAEVPFERLALTERSKAYLYALDRNSNPFAPSWTTLNLRAQYRFKEGAYTFGLENALDQRYRPYSSGISAAGRNFVLGYSRRF